ncbi:hypothetical protein LAZ67_19001877 [Cordylochernes scorpioides]|uniref:Uncharacterized protein n=1 Tax=Cordylochernes scorpioides TaxID=51811 RepID=A0ABY6LI14_9ARAC|nr:hypothetical protein LAZ67_19001877 [Cordylochernes scorpioides]
MVPLSSGSWLLPRRPRLLDLWEKVSSILSLNHRVVPTPALLYLPLVGACRFLATPSLRAPSRWKGVRVRDLAGPVTSLTTSLGFSSIRRCSFGGHAADIALPQALTALPYPGSPASSQPVCIACGSSHMSLVHRYWSCSAVCPLIREVFSIIGRPPDLHSWIFAVGLEDHAITISSAANHAIYVFFVDHKMRGVAGNPLAIFHQTLQRDVADFLEQGKQIPMEEQDDVFILVSHKRKRPAEAAEERQSKRGRVHPGATQPTVPSPANKL